MPHSGQLVSTPDPAFCLVALHHQLHSGTHGNKRASREDGSGSSFLVLSSGFHLVFSSSCSAIRSVHVAHARSRTHSRPVSRVACDFAIANSLYTCLASRQTRENSNPAPCSSLLIECTDSTMESTDSTIIVFVSMLALTLFLAEQRLYVSGFCEYTIIYIYIYHASPAAARLHARQLT